MRQKTAAIVVIGNEILTGKSADRNANFLIGELYQLGMMLRRIVIIPDEVDTIARTVRECAGAFDCVFTSGGVGPTHDDLTISGIARAFDRPVVRHAELESMLRGYFGAGIDEARLRLADMPEGARLLHDNGMRWPVLAIENVYILPGVPELFRSKFEAIRERFRGEPFFAVAIYTREDEFDIAPRLDQIAAEYSAVDVGSYPNFASDEYRVKITLESKDAESVDRARIALLSLLDESAIVRVE